VVASAVNWRAEEMGIRIAPGAQNKDIYHAVLESNGRSVVRGLQNEPTAIVAIFSAVAPLSRKY
jgi:hypothetical protein